MTIELTYLTLSMILAGSLWIPFIVGVNTVGTGDHNPFERPPELRDMPAWIDRANRAHLNMIATLLPFAGLVLMPHALLA